jgi:hypothetical protein
MYSLSRFLPLLLVLFTGPWTLSAQENACSNYLVPFVLRNSQGEIVHHVSAKDLDIKLNGKIVPLDAIHREDRPRRIVILLDASGSMRGFGKEVPWRQAVASADMLATLAEGRARLALLIFNERVIEEIDFGPDNSAVNKRLGELEVDREFEKRAVHGTTRLYDALTRAVQLLPHPTSADTLYLATDGGENSSHTGRSEIENRIGSSGLRVFVSLSESASALRRRQPEDLGSPFAIDAPRESGGGLMIVSQSELKLGFDVHRKLGLLEALRLFFEAVFENAVLQLSPLSLSPEKVSLQVSLSQSSREVLRGAQFFYPRQLSICTPPKDASVAH